MFGKGSGDTRFCRAGQKNVTLSSFSREALSSVKGTVANIEQIGAKHNEKNEACTDRPTRGSGQPKAPARTPPMGLTGRGNLRAFQKPLAFQAPSLFLPAACSSSSVTICSRMSTGASPGRASRVSRRRSSSSLMLPSGYALRRTSRALAQPRLA